MTENESLFGQLIIGPAGSGKTTYCHVISQHLLNHLNREVIIVNLDPDNETFPYQCHLNIHEMIRMTEVMQNENLGPNGSFLYCMDFLYKNIDWLYQRINEEFSKCKQRIQSTMINNSEKIDSQRRRRQRRPYILFDCPGQIELYTNYPVFKNLIHHLLDTNLDPEQSEKRREKFPLNMRLVAINVVDSHYANDPSKFITVVLNCLISMLHIETPFINVLSKIDLIERYGETDFRLDFYCELTDLNRLVERISDDQRLVRYKKLTEAIASIIENYAIVSFVPLNINDMETISKVITLVDRANGFYMADLSSNQDGFNYQL
ncbi:GPN-loop GTPase 2 [Dermatophagoides farinae]|uniref:GPN-loop GTPase 2 n=1 Tax=Dermatophagoides farinae TaxID=6954 RepID=A0A922I745_DERFA|nr:GPN-loop GTPase QQT1-like [Dermatophagoides farinae]XP_046908185.1 GPN-loop GTPase QQT1-like [Dermatophagoides farinae]KAH7638972.1 gpn-loop gtpase qqt1 [Dermatophagoides farinae]KAH9522650.1 GPN-loop GTPase 2 [Dermatophagoides farinae]